MASPQKEKGNTGIANDILERIVSFRFPSASPLQIWLFVARKTYGFQKKTDVISLSQIVRWTGLSKQTVNESLKWLVNAALLVKGKTTEKGIIYAINKDYDTWVVNPAGLVKHRGKSSLARLTHNKNNNNKNNIGELRSPQEKTHPNLLTHSLNQDMAYEHLQDGDITYGDENDKPKKKTYGRYPMLVVTYYMNQMGKQGSGSGYLIAAKELMELAEKEFPTDSRDEHLKEIKFRIDVAVKYYKLKNVSDWRLARLVENWDKLPDWYKLTK